MMLWAYKEVNGDIVLPTSKIYGADVIGQRIENRLRLFRGTWFMNVLSGVDYIGSILVRSPNPKVIASEFASQIANVDGVDAVLQSTCEIRSGVIYYFFRASTSYGLVDGSMESTNSSLSFFRRRL